MITVRTAALFAFIVIVASILIAGSSASAPADSGCRFVPDKTLTGYMATATLMGSGATFPNPLYTQWGAMYEKETGMKLNYQAVGSGQGVTNFKSKLVDFGATDDPVKPADLETMAAIQFPTCIGGVVLIYNLKGIKTNTLKLSPEVLASIFMGKIAKWNDRVLADLNPELKLPDIDITTVHRADGSGTTAIFTSYLTAVSNTWSAAIGAGKTVNWVGGVGQKGNPGVAAYVQQQEGSIGYVEYTYAAENSLSVALLQNASGKFVVPSNRAFAAASAMADWKKVSGFGILLINQPGEEAWPISGATFVLVYKDQTDENKARSMMCFFDWCLRNGSTKAEELHYVSLPVTLIEMIEDYIAGKVKVGGKPLFATPAAPATVIPADVKGYMSSATLMGSGATFPNPLYSQWGAMFEKETGMKLNYQSVGSGQGVTNFKAGLVDFGATDDPIKAEDLSSMGACQFPMAVGGVVLIYNLPGIASCTIKLTPELLADIFLGKVTKWNDKAITSANPDLRLPDKSITTVHRSDGSGTTAIFTSYLAEVSKEWADGTGAGKTVNWATGVGQKGNPGVAAYVQQLEGSIGYVEFTYAAENNLAFTLLRNSAGRFVTPSGESFAAAAASADWANTPGFGVKLVNRTGENSWPISGATFILIRNEQQDAMKAKAMLYFFDWCFRSGRAKADELHYVPIPLVVVEMIEKEWAKQLKCGGTSVWK